MIIIIDIYICIYDNLYFMINIVEMIVFAIKHDFLQNLWENTIIAYYRFMIDIAGQTDMKWNEIRTDPMIQ